jgi:hypothetical protein
MKLEFFGKNWEIITQKIDLPNPQLLVWRSPQNMLFIPLCFHCNITTVLGSVTCLPIFLIKDDTGNTVYEITAPSLLLASLTYHVSAAPGIIHNELLTSSFNIGLPINTPFVESDFILELSAPAVGDAISEATIYGMIAKID